MSAAEPPPDCQACPRLVRFRAANRGAAPDSFNGAVASFGPQTARLLIVGLAPGLGGANRTGRPFTGDWAGDLLYATLLRFGLARGTYQRHADDGLTLIDTMITNAVRCVPPKNKPTAEEIRTCQGYLSGRIAALPRLSVILCLGRIAHDATLRALGQRPAHHPFGHGHAYRITGPAGPLEIISSYHCSRYNTNTRRLTEAMFDAVFVQARAAMTDKTE